MMFTYIMKSQDLYKIGKSNDVESRLKCFKIGNPFIELITKYEGNLEGRLHDKFKDKRVTGEWFRLDESDLRDADEFIKSMPIKTYYQELTHKTTITKRDESKKVGRLHFDKDLDKWVFETFSSRTAEEREEIKKLLQ